MSLITNIYVGGPPGPHKRPLSPQPEMPPAKRNTSHFSELLARVTDITVFRDAIQEIVLRNPSLESTVEQLLSHPSKTDCDIAELPALEQPGFPANQIRIAGVSVVDLTDLAPQVVGERSTASSNVNPSEACVRVSTPAPRLADETTMFDIVPGSGSSMESLVSPACVQLEGAMTRFRNGDRHGRPYWRSCYSDSDDSDGYDSDCSDGYGQWEFDWMPVSLCVDSTVGQAKAHATQSMWQECLTLMKAIVETVFGMDIAPSVDKEIFRRYDDVSDDDE